MPTKIPRFYAPELDSLRFLAFLFVYCRHVTTSYGTARHQMAALPAVISNVGGGINQPSSLSPMLLRIQSAAGAFDFGVCLFFFLSAYLITRLLLIEKHNTGAVNIPDFYLRRTLRIWPLYFVFLAFVAVFRHHLPNITWPRILASVFFVGNWPAVFNGWAASPIDVLWSVSVEEQFYLVWPHFAKWGKRGVLAVSLIMVLISVCTLVYLGSRPQILNSRVWANTFVQCIFFAGGATAGVYLKPERYTISRIVRILLFGAGFGCWLVASMACHLAREISPGPVSLLCGYALVLTGILFIFMSFANLNHVYLPRISIYLGKISYGLYVVHVLMLELSIAAVHHFIVMKAGKHPPLIVLHLVSSVCALVATIVVASASYKCLESPFLVLKKRFTLVASRPV
ncbi:MAG: acyltransferase [Acidobacteria bacterium]|nr:acyltransferase [Acidobacteriota bacterium]